MASEVSYIFKAVDEFTAPARKIGDQLKKIEHIAEHAAHRLKTMGQSARRMGEEMMVFLDVPIAFLTKESVEEYNKAQVALTQINLTLKNTHDAAGFTAENLKKMDEALSNKSVFDRTQILNDVTRTLLRFSTIHGETFKKAQQVIVDYSSATGTSLKSAASLIGRVLSDPSKGLLRLSRVGIVFTEKQQKVIEQLVKTNHLAAAQTYIFSRLSIMHGAAAAELNTSAGEIKNFNKHLTDLKTSLGKLVVVYFAPFLKYLIRFTEYFQSLSPHTKKWIVIIAAGVFVFSIFIAYLGIFLTSLSAVIETLKVLTVVEWAAISPLAIIGAAIGVFAYAAYNAYTQGNLLRYTIAAVGIAVGSLIVMFRIGMGPISWVISALQLLGLGFAYAYKHSERFREFVRLLLKDIQPLVREIMILVKMLENFGGKAISGIENFMGLSQNPVQLSTSQSFLQSPSLMNQQNSKVDVNLHVNDRTNVIKSVNATKTGNANFNLGRNMDHAG